jgi:hypothetical protein
MTKSGMFLIPRRWTSEIRIHVGHDSKGRIDGFEVGDVVAHIGLAGRRKWGEPYYVNAEVMQVVERGRCPLGHRCLSLYTM